MLRFFCSLATLVVLGAMTSPAIAQNCTWGVTPNLSAPDTDSAADSGSSGGVVWGWSFNYSAGPYHIEGDMYALAELTSISLSKAGAGNGTITVQRLIACPTPVEDIEAFARTEFKAAAHLDDDNNVMCAGNQRIKSDSPAMDAQAAGGVSLSNEELEEGQPSGTIELELWGATISIQWAMSGGDDIQQVFFDSDSGTGGHSPATFVLHTDLQLDVNISDSNGIYEEGSVELSDSKAELKVWGTCDGLCGAMILVYHYVDGF